MGKYQITLNEKQLHTLLKATEAFSRLCIGQFDHALEECWGDRIFKLPHDQREIIQQKGRIIMMLLSGGKLDGYQSSYGIHSSEIDPHALPAFNIHQVLRHQLWKERPEKDRINYTVDSSVCITNGEEPIEITKIED